MKRLLSVCLLLLVVLMCAAPVFAQDENRGPGQLVFGRNVRLKAGEAINGDLTLIGGNLVMAAGSRVTGNVVVFGGSAEVAGEVKGDVSVIGNSAYLKPTASVDGDVSSVGGRVSKQPGAQVRGDVVETGGLDFGRFLPWGSNLRFGLVSPGGTMSSVAESIFRIIRAALLSMVVAIVGLLVVLFLPEHTRVIGGAVTGATAASFGTGLLTMLVGAAVIIVLVITICLAPIGVLLALPLALATLLGWAAVGYLVGQRLMSVLKKDATPAPAVTALVGVLALTGVQQGLMVLSGVPCLGFLFWLLGAGLWLVAACVGLGAVVLSRLGTQPYAGSAPINLPPPAAPPPCKDRGLPQVAAGGPAPAPEGNAIVPYESQPLALGPQPAPAENPDAPEGGAAPDAAAAETTPTGDADAPQASAPPPCEDRGLPPADEKPA